LFTLDEAQVLLMMINEYFITRSEQILYTTKCQRDLRKHKKLNIMKNVKL
jgi:hypothetical protein